MYTALPKGTIVFAKTIGYEPFPATITRYNNKTNVYSVSFINHKSTSTVAPHEVEEFSPATVEHYRQKYEGSQDKEHKKILRSIQAALPKYHKLQKKLEKAEQNVMSYSFVQAQP